MKNEAFSSLVGVLLSLAICFFTFGNAEAGNGPVQLKATIEKTSGSVIIKKSGSFVSHDAKVGDILAAGDFIETRSNGKVQIKIENGNVISLKPDSKLIVKDLTSDPSTGTYINSFESPKGLLRAKVEKLKGNSKFEVKTPTAVGSVRGTVMYLRILKKITYAYFRNGSGHLLNPKSGIWKLISDLQNAFSDNKGNVSDPGNTPENEQNEWEGGWEPIEGEGYSEPGEDDLGDDENDDNSDEGMNDINNSRPGNLNYGDNGTGGDGGGSEENEIADEENEEEDSRIFGAIFGGSSTQLSIIPFKYDKDYYDGFVDFGDYNSFSMLFGLIDTEWASGGIYDRINSLGGVSYGSEAVNDAIRYELRGDIFGMLKDHHTRQIDSVLERITDAQTSKVLTDAYGNRVRIEQYVLRPDSNTVELLNVSLRTEEAGSLAGLNTLDWKTTFSRSLDTLSSGQIRDLPWSNYLDSYGNSIASPGTPGNVYPDNMSIELRNANNYLREKTDFASRKNGWQNIQSKTLSFDLAGIGSRNNLSIKNRVVDSDPTFWNPVTIRPIGDPGAPDGFKYDVFFFGLRGSTVRSIYVSFNVISDDSVNMNGSYNGVGFNTLGDALRANLASGKNIGNNNLQMTVSANNSKLIDVIYVPMPRMTWSDINWSN
ncbi:MAG: FecR domain-containing protein [Candidatus Omnitrophica bacterium]|nr:FecR domain-containing protein [Candidatus Omnitrophota bacterium]